jgi:hypothetical protein
MPQQIQISVDQPTLAQLPAVALSAGHIVYITTVNWMIKLLLLNAIQNNFECVFDIDH